MTSPASFARSPWSLALVVAALVVGCATTPPLPPQATPAALVDGNPKNGTSLDGLTIPPAAIDAIELRSR